MTFLDSGLLLVLLIAVPVIGALVIAALAATSAEAGRRYALAVALTTALLTCGLSWRLIGRQTNPALVVNAPWIPTLGIWFTWPWMVSACG